ncbi:MAG: ABC transporter ATP-binding protein [Angelakisella sp.]
MAIELNGITKQFKTVTALENVTCTLADNKIYGLLGRNGAGKTTLLSLITNRQFASAGTILVDGENAVENDHAQGKIYCMGEQTYFPNEIKVRELFRWTKEFYPAFDTDYANALTKKFALDTKSQFKTLSTGYASICKLIVTMATGAPYLLFDEPVLGLDANHRELFYRELLTLYSEKPCTVVISTHLIEEVADVIEQVVMLKSGKLLMDRPVEEVMKLGYTVSGRASEVEQFCKGRTVLSVDALGGLKTACLYTPDGNRPSIPAELDVGALDLQKLFIQLTNASGDERKDGMQQ